MIRSDKEQRMREQNCMCLGKWGGWTDWMQFKGERQTKCIKTQINRYNFIAHTTPKLIKFLQLSLSFTLVIAITWLHKVPGSWKTAWVCRWGNADSWDISTEVRKTFEMSMRLNCKFIFVWLRDVMKSQKLLTLNIYTYSLQIQSNVRMWISGFWKLWKL